MTSFLSRRSFFQRSAAASLAIGATYMGFPKRAYATTTYAAQLHTKVWNGTYNPGTTTKRFHHVYSGGSTRFINPGKVGDLRDDMHYRIDKCSQIMHDHGFPVMDSFDINVVSGTGAATPYDTLVRRKIAPIVIGAAVLTESEAAIAAVYAAEMALLRFYSYTTAGAIMSGLWAVGYLLDQPSPQPLDPVPNWVDWGFDSTSGLPPTLRFSDPLAPPPTGFDYDVMHNTGLELLNTDSLIAVPDLLQSNPAFTGSSGWSSGSMGLGSMKLEVYHD